tara:strand:+ start:1023 stop:1661 length:639 start_codon:yes stop_codon:yes gene_type:complete
MTNKNKKEFTDNEFVTASVDEKEDTNKIIHELLNKVNELSDTIKTMDKRDETFRDFIVEMIVNKKEIVNVSLTQTKTKKNNDNIVLDEYYNNMSDKLKQDGKDEKNFVEKNNKTCLKDIDDKLKENTANNVKNCFVWCYSHINEIRLQTLKLPNIEQDVIALYTNKKELAKHNKNLIDLLKYEANETYKKYKEESFFKAHCAELKKICKDLI